MAKYLPTPFSVEGGFDESYILTASLLRLDAKGGAFTGESSVGNLLSSESTMVCSLSLAALGEKVGPPTLLILVDMMRELLTSFLRDFIPVLLTLN